MAAEVDGFIARWQDGEGGQERANYALFLSELCDVLGVERPQPANATRDGNDYVFERQVRTVGREGQATHRRIDLYRRDRFVLEAKQSRWAGEKNELPGHQGSLLGEAQPTGRRGGGRTWDALMQNARRQAEDYVRLLPEGHLPPPFVIVCDVGHCLELYANFRRDGKAYDQFPDRQSFRVYLEDLRLPAVRDRLRAVWTDPDSLDPTRRAALVTRDIAERLAAVSKALERSHDPEEVALFLVRIIFTLFAEDVGLLPAASFQTVLERCLTEPEKFPRLVEQLWEAMDTGDFAFALERKVKRFNGRFFKERQVIPLAREEIGELLQAARHDWRTVEPAVFGALLEQALDPSERKRLGAHYTPRAYVERLVVATVIEPLRAEWEIARATIDDRKARIAERGPYDPQRDRLFAEARAIAEAMHARLCKVRVLDPACGTGNFLYVALELLKKLEAEVLDVLEMLGGQEAIAWMGATTVDPKQFLGLEVNPRAAAIAELVLWIGYFQFYARNYAGEPPEPILHAYGNIVCMDAVLSPPDGIAREPDGRPKRRRLPDGSFAEVPAWTTPRQPPWPAAEFIVGNPPFIGGKDIRGRLGDAYAEALWAAHPQMNESADFVMYWWDRAADLLTRKGTLLRRFGLVTTNSITQVFQRRVVERHLKGKAPVSLVMAIADHPWTKATRDSAAVRIAMTVAEAGTVEGRLMEVVAESGLETDTPTVVMTGRDGTIHPDLSVGVDVVGAVPLLANEGLCSRGMSLHGAGFIVTPREAEALGLGRRPGLETHIRPYLNGKDLTGRSRGVMVIDLFGLEEDEVRERFPEVYQHVLYTVRPERSNNSRQSYRDRWWTFGEARVLLREALKGVSLYLSTVETSKHRVFVAKEKAYTPDNRIVVFCIDDYFALGVLSSRHHGYWALVQGGTLEDRPIYTKTRCFDPFPFPDCDDLAKHRIRVLAADLDGHRKARQTAHPHLTLTDLCNVLERLRAGEDPDGFDVKARRVFDDGLVLVLKDLHDRLDAAVAAAYGWPADLADEEILARLVALNAERAEEERRGLVRWLRPDFQVPRFGTPKDKAELALAGAAPDQGHAPAQRRPSFPTREWDQMEAVVGVLRAAGRPMDAAAVAARFRQGRRVERRVNDCLQALWRIGAIDSGDRGVRYQVRRAA